MNYPLRLLKTEQNRLSDRLSEARKINYEEAIKEIAQMQSEVDTAISILEKAGNVNEA